MFVNIPDFYFFYVWLEYHRQAQFHIIAVLTKLCNELQRVATTYNDLQRATTTYNELNELQPVKKNMYHELRNSYLVRRKKIKF